MGRNPATGETIKIAATKGSISGSQRALKTQLCHQKLKSSGTSKRRLTFGCSDGATDGSPVRGGLAERAEWDVQLRLADRIRGAVAVGFT